MRDGEQKPISATVALGMALRRARTKYCCSLRDLGQQGGVSASFLSRVENAQERPSERILLLYAERFRVDSDDLFRLAGRVPSDMIAHLVRKPGAVKKIRAQMARVTVSDKSPKHQRRRGNDAQER